MSLITKLLIAIAEAKALGFRHTEQAYIAMLRKELAAEAGNSLSS